MATKYGPSLIYPAPVFARESKADGCWMATTTFHLGRGLGYEIGCWGRSQEEAERNLIAWLWLTTEPQAAA